VELHFPKLVELVFANAEDSVFSNMNFSEYKNFAEPICGYGPNPQVYALQKKKKSPVYNLYAYKDICDLFYFSCLVKTLER